MSAVPSPSQIDILNSQADLIRASGILGRPGQLSKLFDFLVECSLADKPVKEATIAIDVFGKDASFDVAQDALVRVYAHKLRKKLDEFYAGEGRAEAQRLVIPRGNYSLIIEPNTAPVLPFEAIDVDTNPQLLRRRWLALGAIAVTAAALIGYFAAAFISASQDEMSDVRDQPIWKTLLANERPINIVVGDYFIFGDTQDGPEIKRMVREFDVNSRTDLDQLLMSHPELASRYVDMDLQYLPTSTAYVLRDVMLVLAPARKRIRVMQMSDFNAEALRSENVVYIGLLSGLGLLRNSVFERSRLSIGETFDELIDTTSKTRYTSGESWHHPSGPNVAATKYSDYGYVTSFPGPGGNRVLALTGTRDVGLMQLSTMLTQMSSLSALGTQSKDNAAVEALYQVTGINRTNLDGKLLWVSELKPGKTPK